MEYFTKKPTEKYGKSIDFTSRLPDSVTLLSGTVAAIDCETGQAAASVLVSGALVISGNFATATVQAGSAERNYKLTYAVTLSDSSVLAEELLMQVRA